MIHYNCINRYSTDNTSTNTHTITRQINSKGAKAMLTLDVQSRIPIYEQLKNKIGELILLGVLKPGDQLPSVRVLARDLGVNPNTVSKAYQDLERDGIIYSISGKGSFISDIKNSSTMLLEQYLAKFKRAAEEIKMGGISFDIANQTLKEVYNII